MAWRIDEQVIRGEIDNRTRGRVSGRIWLVGRPEPVVLELEGNPWRDLAGHLLRFSNPEAKPGDLSGLTDRQVGMAGDITASRKVKVPECSMEEFKEYYAARKPFPWHWGNSLYLEWFSGSNGRVVVESAAYQLEIDPDASWCMSEEEETAQRVVNESAMTDFMERLGGAGGVVEDETDEDAPRSVAEADADAEDARMSLLLDRVTARLEREGHDGEQFERIYEEESERLRRERGEQAVVLTPEQEAERESWIEEMNAAAEESMAEMETERWKGESPVKVPHPLVERCSNLAVAMHHEMKAGKWLTEEDHLEHPLREIVNGVMIASAKLAGALGNSVHDEEWPPSALFAGNVLVRLKKARGCLRDAMRGLDAADEEKLATPQWRTRIRREVSAILAEIQRLIDEVRGLLGGEG